jgi:pimeloyl-ACP methyl ester carboxylesterase
MQAKKDCDIGVGEEVGFGMHAYDETRGELLRLHLRGCDIAALVMKGSSPPIVLLHGNSSSSQIWTHQIPLLREMGRAVIAIDLPGHGESGNSPTPAITYSFPGYASIVQDLLDELAVPVFDAVGWSLGGHIGLELLATDPRLRALMIIGAPPARPCADVLGRVFFNSENLNLASRRELTDDDIEAYAAAMLGGPEFVSRAALHNIRRTDGQARKCMFENALSGIGTDEVVTVETSANPLCVVHGEREAFVRLDYLMTLRYRSLCDGKIHVVPEAGHAPHWQAPELFNVILRRFLSLHAPTVHTGELKRLQAA